MLMYSTCLFCNRPLGSNEAIEHFPVGRRLAFDPEKGRLWVVCRKCERWNLSPLEIRWEAIEQCERRFRETRLRVSTDNVGLAKLKEGLELVRIGVPLRPEFAAWRYGDQFGRRRRRAIAYTAAGVTAGGLIIVGGIAAGASLGGMWWLVPRAIQNWQAERVVSRLRNERGDPIRVQGKHLETSRVVPIGYEGGWALQLRYAEGWKKGSSKKSHTMLLTGDEAIRVAGQLMAAVNRAGGSKKTIQYAVRRIEEAGDPARYLQDAAREADRFRSGKLASVGPGKEDKIKAGSLKQLPAPTRLAIEMATQEQAEREAMEGELQMLEAAWREAEEIAQIADTLLVPTEVDTFIEAEKERLKTSGQLND